MKKTKSFSDFSAKAEVVCNMPRTSKQKSMTLLNLVLIEMLVLLNGVFVQFVDLCLWMWRMFVAEKELVSLRSLCINTSALTGKY